MSQLALDSRIVNSGFLVFAAAPSRNTGQVFVLKCVSCLVASPFCYSCVVVVLWILGAASGNHHRRQLASSDWTSG